MPLLPSWIKEGLQRGELPDGELRRPSEVPTPCHHAPHQQGSNALRACRLCSLQCILCSMLCALGCATGGVLARRNAEGNAGCCRLTRSQRGGSAGGNR